MAPFAMIAVLAAARFLSGMPVGADRPPPTCLLPSNQTATAAPTFASIAPAPAGSGDGLRYVAEDRSAVELRQGSRTGGARTLAVLPSAFPEQAWLGADWSSDGSVGVLWRSGGPGADWATTDFFRVQIGEPRLQPIVTCDTDVDPGGITASVSPNGDAVAITAGDAYVWEGEAVRRVGPSAEARSYTESEGGVTRAGSVTWSPDGSEAAYIVRDELPGSPPGAEWVEAVRRDGTGHRRLTENRGSIEGPAVHAGLAWPHPDAVLWSSYDVSGAGFDPLSRTSAREILVTDVQTGTTRDLAPGGGLISFAAALSPDRTMLAVSASTDASRTADLYVVRIDAAQTEQITDHPGEDASPVWSSDSQVLGFVRTDNNRQEARVVGADGAGEAVVGEEREAFRIHSIAWIGDD